MTPGRSHALRFENRLHYSWEYRRFFNQSEVLRLSQCTIFRVKNEVGYYRLGITLKARGNSVQRNRVKRKIREAFRTHSEFLGSYDYNVVVPGSKKLAFPYPEKLALSLKAELKNALARASGP